MGRASRIKREAKQQRIQAGRVSLQLLQERNACGECTACCSMLTIKELGKPPRVDCKHLPSGKCSIYSTRPRVCRDYACAWKISEGDPLERPDRGGVLVSFDQDEDAPILSLIELRPRALIGQWSIARALEYLDRLQVGGTQIRVFPHGTPVVASNDLEVDPAYGSVDVGENCYITARLRNSNVAMLCVGRCIPPGTLVQTIVGPIGRTMEELDALLHGPLSLYRSFLP